MKTINLTIPTTWRELTKKQLRQVANVMNEKFTREEALFLLFCLFTGIRRCEIKHTLFDGKAEEGQEKYRFADPEGNTFYLEMWQIAHYCDMLSFLIDTAPCDIVNPTKVDGHLLDTSFGDYFHADSLFYGYSLTKGTNLVLQAMKDLGDDRESINEDEATMLHIWWRGVQEYLKQQYPNVFAEGDGTSPYDPLETRKNIMLMLNDNRPQDNEAIEKANVHDVLAALDSKIEQNKQMKEKTRC